MHLNMKIKFTSESSRWLCFKHAVKHAQEGEDIEIELGDYDSEYYMGTTVCTDCSGEE